MPNYYLWDGLTAKHFSACSPSDGQIKAQANKSTHEASNGIAVCLLPRKNSTFLSFLHFFDSLHLDKRSRRGHIVLRRVVGLADTDPNLPLRSPRRTPPTALLRHFATSPPTSRGQSPKDGGFAQKRQLFWDHHTCEELA